MEREFVDSSMIASIDYNRESAILEIEFKSNGQVWQYYSVPEEVYNGLKYSDSKGRYFHANIKNQYSESRVS